MSIDTIGINIFLNLILVNEYIKPAFLIPTSNCCDSITQNLLSEITQAFPFLKQSINYKVYNGVIISHNDYTHYNGPSISSHNIGSLLGYPFYENFNNISNNYNTYTININVKLKNKTIETLFTNVCIHITEEIIESFNIFTESAMDIFNNQKYITLLGECAVIDVYTEIIQKFAFDIIIEKVINNINLEKYDLDTIHSILINLNFSENFQICFNSYFQYTNKIHKGILIGILLNSKYSLLNQLKNTQSYTEKYNKWESKLIKIIKKTQEHTHSNILFCIF